MAIVGKEYNPYDYLVAFCKSNRISVKEENRLRDIINKIIEYNNLKPNNMENNKIDWDAFKEGWDSWDLQELQGVKQNNPYEPNTIIWKSWNRGYNCNTRGVNTHGIFNNSEFCESCGGRNCIC